MVQMVRRIGDVIEIIAKFCYLILDPTLKEKVQLRL